MHKTIYYTKVRYKYRLHETHWELLPIRVEEPLITRYVTLTPYSETRSLLMIKEGFGWDGASGPTIDDSTNMRGSLVHDALAELLQVGLLHEMWIPKVNAMLRDICIEDGMPEERADVWFEAVQITSPLWAREKGEPKIYTAP